MMDRVRSKGSRSSALVVALATVCAALAVPGSQSVPAGAASATIERPAGAGPPVAASGVGTQAALDNPRCRHDDPKYGPYGRFDTAVVGGGPVCVKAWKAGADNGGATAPGVTKDRITVVAVVPNETQLQTDPVKPNHMADRSLSTYVDAIHDYLLPQMKFYETWGRDIEVKFITSSGSDEAAQRADVVAVKAMKPFAVFHEVVKGLDVLETEIAKAKIPIMGFSTTATKANQQAPYRWGPSDSQAAALNSAEVIGKQLVGKKAQYAGDDVKDQTRKFGVVYIKTLVDYPQFVDYFKKYGGTITNENPYDADGSTFGNSTVSEELAPTMVTRMKAAGVTTVIMLGDFSMNKALMDNATKQEWNPEWFFTGAVYADIGTLARALPAGAVPARVRALVPHAVHRARPAAGSTRVATVDPGQSAQLVLRRERGHAVGCGHHADPLAARRHPDRRPQPHAEDVRAGSVLPPAAGGAAQNRVSSTLSGYGKGPNLPYDEYASNGLDFAPTGGTRTRPARRTARARWARVSAGTPTAPSATSPRPGRRSRSTGSTRTRPSTTSRPVKDRCRSTWVTARRDAPRQETAVRQAVRAGPRSCSRRTAAARTRGRPRPTAAFVASSTPGRYARKLPRRASTGRWGLWADCGGGESAWRSSSRVCVWWPRLRTAGR